ncbi:hypothetical protein [Celeribacter sp.]|uniref:oxidoreductase n=1 Tax=Celeribacter sp. TaxID=1890673 RepID=UPI003A95B53F
MMGVHLAHSGRKAFSQPLWRGDQAMTPAEIDAASIDWRRVGPSAISASSEWSTPEELSIEEIAKIRQQHVDTARRANAAGMDVVELHYGHGYLVASFLSPIGNTRDDVYGTARAGRMRIARGEDARPAQLLAEPHRGQRAIRHFACPRALGS